MTTTMLPITEKMMTSATMSDPTYTPHGALFPMVTVTPTRHGDATISITDPSGQALHAEATEHEIRNIRDYLSMVLGER